MFSKDELCFNLKILILKLKFNNLYIKLEKEIEKLEKQHI